MELNLIWAMLSTAGLAVTGVTIWTVRLAVTARGNKALSSLLAATEAMLFVVVFSKLLAGFDSPHLVVSYGAGVAAGTLLGLTLDGRLNPQLSRVDIFDPTGAAIRAVAESGFPYTRSDGFGSTGQISVASVVTSDARVKDLLEVVARSESDSFWTVAPVRRAHEVRVPGGHRQLAAPRVSRGFGPHRSGGTAQPAAPQRIHEAAHV